MTDPMPPAPTAPSFDAMKLSDGMLRALQDVGYEQPTPVQSQTFEAVSAGRDVIVQSRTGSGKTAAFVIPILERLLRPDPVVQSMTLCPTRELALQVTGEFERLGKHLGVRAAAVYGGASMTSQIAALESGARVVVGTPGRVLDLMKRRALDVSALRVFVLDEGDEMLSMGFAEELHAILERLPKIRQGLIFSATMPDSIQRIAQRHLREPEFIALSSDHVAPDELIHQVFFCSGGANLKDLARVLEIEHPEAALVFCNTRNETETVARGLQQLGLAAEYLNGDLAQSDRERVLGALRDGRVQYLVATDVAARGIDVPHLSHVVNFGFPEAPEQYVHRTGRTGRAGRAGTAISLVGPRDIGNLYFLRLTYKIRPIERMLPSVGEERTRREADRLSMLLEAFPSEASEESLAIARRLLTHDDAERVIGSLIGAFLDIGRREIVPDATVRAPSVPPPAPRAPSLRPEVPRPSRRPTVPGTENRPLPRGDRQGPRVTEPERPRRVDVHHGDGVSPGDEDGEDAGMEELRLAVGRRDGIRAGDVSRLLRDVARLQRKDIGRISVRDRFSLANVTADKLPEVIAALRDQSFADHPLAPEKGRAPGPTSTVATVSPVVAPVNEAPRAEGLVEGLVAVAPQADSS